MSKHAISRAEWEQRFHDRIKQRTDVHDETVFEQELDSWPPNTEDWKDALPEEAADENLSYWDDDGET